MPFLTVQDTRLYYTDAGHGPIVLLLHANPGDLANFKLITDELSKKFRVIALDWPGYGKSKALCPVERSGALAFYQVLACFIETLNLKDLIILGNSVGGFAAAKYALDFPESVSALILVSPGGFSHLNWFKKLFIQLKSHKRFSRLLSPAFIRMLFKSKNAAVRQTIKKLSYYAKNDLTLTIDTLVWRSFLEPEHNLTNHKINVRTLLIFGRYDPVIDYKTDGKNAQASCSNSKLVIMNTGHEPFIENPRDFLRNVYSFLEVT